MGRARPALHQARTFDVAARAVLRDIGRQGRLARSWRGEEAVVEVGKAIERGEATASVGGVAVPATPETLRTLGELRPPEKPPEEPDDNSEPGSGEEPDVTVTPPLPKLVAKTKTNYHVLDFERTLEARPEPERPPEPAMRSTLREHQTVALDWMRACWRAGRPGILLSDDMGLGKTIEVLSFLSALREAGERRPFLIVAPTSLLDNWTREHDTHLERGIGLRVTAYAGGLKALRTDAGRETELGRALLDRGRLGLPGGDGADGEGEPVFVLTTYETLRDYQFSFATVPFAVAVYDETQKVKNPKSRATAAAKSINADLSIAMTGTPVENSMADLWSICDLVSPGMLPPLRDFHRECSPDHPKNLEALRDALLEPRPDGTPPFALRRMKSEVVALPALHEVPLPRTMEGPQADAYGEAVNRAIKVGGRERLRVLHDMRSISLHPTGRPEEGVTDEAYIAASARMREAFAVLDRVHAADDKVIVFLQSLKVQNVLASLIATRYRLPADPPIVRGDTPPRDRQRRVDEFCAAPGFGAIILSPRAAGVGLNVQAATHVIHLDRWWNPAVEDQCTARAYRIGQTREVTVHYPMALHPGHGDGSYDAVLDRVLSEKRALARSLFVPTELSGDDFARMMGGVTGTQADDDLARIDARGAGSFEAWVVDRLRAAGLDARETPGSGDGGADAIVRDGERIVAIVQCKHTGHPDRPVDGGVARDMERAPVHWQAPDARFIAVTNAENFAPRTRKKLLEGGAMIAERAELMRLGEIVASVVGEPS